jgi:DNA end-binding protein Ku
MPRVLWKGAISFGLINIPVGLYSAEKRNELSFTLLDRRDLTPVGYNRVNKDTGKDVPWDQVVKGYEYEKGRYVVMSDADFAHANVRATQTVEILSFVRAEQIPFVLYETPYFLAPDKRGEKGYALLRETLRRAGKVALTQVVIRTRQHLAALAPLGPVLVLDTLRYADELRSIDELDLPGEQTKAKASEREVEMALRLVEEMSENWEPNKYHDTYREDVLARVQQKIDEGKTEVITKTKPKTETRGAQVIDLMDLLKRSVQQKGRKDGEQNVTRRNLTGAAKAARPRRHATAAAKQSAASQRRRRA